MRVLITAACIAMPFVAHAAELKSSYDDIVTQAKLEAELNFVASSETFGGQDAMIRLQDAFNQKYAANITLRFTPGPSMPAIAARLQQEAAASAPASTDLYIGPLSSFAFLKKEGVLSTIAWADTFPGVSPEMEISKGLGVLVRTSLNAIVYNSEELDANSAPKTHADLIDPVKSEAWKGRLAMAPYPDWLVEQALVLPKEEVLAYARKLAPLVSGFLRYGEEERVVSGEFVVMASTGDGPGYTATWQKRGAPLAFVIGMEPALTNYFQVAVPKNSSHPNLAALFGAFLTSPEAQQIIDDVSFQGSHLSPNTTVAKYIASTGITPMAADKLWKFYEAGEDKELSAELKTIFKK